VGHVWKLLSFLNFISISAIKLASKKWGMSEIFQLAFGGIAWRFIIGFPRH
jgi:hypothetical protein